MKKSRQHPICFAIKALLLVCAFGMPISVRGESPKRVEEILLALDVNVGDGDVVRGFYLKREGNNFLFRHRDFPSLICRIPVIWLTDAQARLVNIDKMEVLSELARLASSNEPEDKEELRKSLVIEVVKPRAQVK